MTRFRRTPDAERNAFSFSFAARSRGRTGQLIDLVAKVLARVRIDDGDRRRDGEAGGVTDRARRARRRLHDLLAKADLGLAQGLAVGEAAADQLDDFRILGEFAVVE